MARRRKSGLDQAIEVTAKLPWKLSVLLAPISYGEHEPIFLWLFTVPGLQGN